MQTSQTTSYEPRAGLAMGAPDALNNIPAELRARRQWVLFDADKVPVNASTGGNAMSNVPATWSHFDQARRALGRIGKARNVGIILTENDPYCGGDLDSCFAPDGSPLSWAGDVLEAVKGLAYIEKSRSGTGIRIILRGRAGGTHKLNLGPHTGIELYDAHPLIMTGDVLPGSVAILPPAQQALDAILSEFFPEPVRTPAPRSYTPAGSRTQGYGAAALRLELDDLARATEGTRNHTLNRAAFSLGQLIAGGELDAGDVESALLAGALGIGLPEPEARKTIASGLRAGMQDPRCAPARPVIAAPSTPAPRAPWVMTGRDWSGCDVCGCWHKDAGDSFTVRVGLHFGSCGKMSCPVARRMRTWRILKGVESWGQLYAARVDPSSWRRVRDRLTSDHWRRLPQPDGADFVVVDGLLAASLPGALPCSWEDVFSAAQSTPAGSRTGKPHTDRAQGAGVFIGPLAQADRVQGDTNNITPGQERFVKVAQAGKDDAERRALRRALTVRLPEAWQVNHVDLWLRCGLAVDADGKHAEGDLEAGKRLALEVAKIRAEHRDRQLRNTVGGVSHCAIDAGPSSSTPHDTPDDARGSPGGGLAGRKC